MVASTPAVIFRSHTFRSPFWFFIRDQQAEFLAELKTSSGTETPTKLTISQVLNKRRAALSKEQRKALLSFTLVILTFLD
jgi:hypothetical protein